MPSHVESRSPLATQFQNRTLRLAMPHAGAAQSTLAATPRQIGVAASGQVRRCRVVRSGMAVGITSEGNVRRKACG
jgi:hypothetical protein